MEKKKKKKINISETLVKDYYFWWNYYDKEKKQDIKRQYVKGVMISKDYRHLSILIGTVLKNTDTIDIPIADLIYYIKKEHKIDILTKLRTDGKYASTIVENGEDITLKIFEEIPIHSSRERLELTTTVSLIEFIDNRLVKKYTRFKKDFLQTRFAMKGSIGEELFESVIKTCINNYDLNIAIKRNITVDKSHIVDFVIEAVDGYSKPVVFSFLEIKSMKHMNQFSWFNNRRVPVLQTGISKKQYKRYKQINDSGQKVYLVFVDHCGFPPPDNSMTEDGHYTDYNIKDKGMMYGISFDDFEKTSEVSFKNKHSDKESEAKNFQVFSEKVKYPLELDDQIVVDLKRMKELTFLLEEITGGKGIDYNLNYIPDNVNKILSILSTTKR